MVLNPLRAGMVTALDDWPWSSSADTTERLAAPVWLDADGLLQQFATERRKAIKAYRQFVMRARVCPARWPTKCAINCCSATTRLLSATSQLLPTSSCGRSQRRIDESAMPLEKYQARHRDKAMVRAYLSCAHTMAMIAEYFGVHYMTVSRAVRKIEGGRCATVVP